MLLKKIYHSVLLLLLPFSLSYADQGNLSLFPLEHYDQTISNWIKPNDPEFDRPQYSSTVQQNHLNNLKKHWIGSSSPWNATYVNKIISHPAPDDIATIEKSILYDFNNQDKTEDKMGYGVNFRPYPLAWSTEIEKNINLFQFANAKYHAINRAIVIENLSARALPTDDVFFYDYKIAGQGYPFDNLQTSALWIGTPVYILGETLDHEWSLVLTPDFIAWVKSLGIARVNNAFVNTWENSAKKHLIAITNTKTSLLDEQKQFLGLAYIGTIFPGKQVASGIEVDVPVQNYQHNAIIKKVILSTENAAVIPLLPTPHNFSNLMSSLIGRPYGWGNMYFYNDCSAELKNLLVAFGIWLPRHSAEQVYSGKLVDMTFASPKQRVNYLLENGRRFFTIVYIGGHVVMYIGSYPNPNDRSHDLMAVTYQDVWGLSPLSGDRRAVIGKSVIFPMLLQYPEDTQLNSLANKKYFQVSYLDEIPNYLIKLETIDLKSLMYPD